MLEIRNLEKSYPNKRVLRNIDLKLDGGEVVGLFGENGAGKTTLMKCILGFIPHKGEVLLDGEPVTRKNIARLSFATSEHAFFPGLTGRGHREFYKDQFPKFSEKRFDALMDFFELPGKRPVGKFSTGQKNQFEVILALSQGADYILMDEPFAGNDVFNREDFYKVLLGILTPRETVFISTHLIEEVSAFISRAVLLNHGTIAQDVTAAELDEQGVNLIDFVKTTYNYRSDRVKNALERLTEGEEEE